MPVFRTPPLIIAILPYPALILLSVLLLAAAGYLAFRFFSLKRALREINRDLTEIRQNLSQNQILHLPLPDRDLERLTDSMNAALEDMRRERQSYEKREAEFQKLIENISHDLRTPLTVILGYLKWMKKADNAPLTSSGHDCSPLSDSKDIKDVKDIKDSKDILDILERNARAMEKLVAQFYDFSRLNARDYALTPEEVDVCRILKESIANNYQVLEEACLSLDCHLPEHPVIIQGNTGALERIFSNLFQNAGRYARSILDIRLEENGSGQVCIYFQNDSDSVREDDLPHLFDRFYKNDSSRHQEGSGLGLTVARSLAELMGGTLTADAAPSSETGQPVTELCFTLTLKL